MPLDGIHTTKNDQYTQGRYAKRGYRNNDTKTRITMIGYMVLTGIIACTVWLVGLTIQMKSILRGNTAPETSELSEFKTQFNTIISQTKIFNTRIKSITNTTRSVTTSPHISSSTQEQIHKVLSDTIGQQ